VVLPRRYEDVAEYYTHAVTGLQAPQATTPATRADQSQSHSQQQPTTDAVPQPLTLLTMDLDVPLVSKLLYTQASYCTTWPGDLMFDWSVDCLVGYGIFALCIRYK
jgi:hypothetical protein